MADEGAVVAVEEPRETFSAAPPAVDGGKPAYRPVPFWVPVAVGVLGIVAVNAAVLHTELVTGRYVTGGVPPVAAFAALLLMLGLRAPLRRFLRLDLSREQLLIIYSMVSLGTFLAGAYSVRAFLPHLLSVQYWNRTQTALAPFVRYFPSWFAPTDPIAIREYFEGNHGGGVPWALWIGPLTLWLLFWSAMFGAGWCLMLLLRRQWLQNERLSFPLLALPLALTEEGSRSGSRPLVRNPVLWMGIGIAAIYDGLNIAHAFAPGIPAPGFWISFSGLFTERHLAPLNSIGLFYMPEGIGFGYFVPLEVSFSVWFFYLLEKLLAVGALASGYDTPGIPFFQEQSAGAYLATAALLLAGAAGPLKRLWTRAFLQSSKAAGPEDREARGAWIGLTVCSLSLLGFAVQAGLAFRIALLYLAILACFMLVYVRLRAETGAPFEFIYPYGLPKEVVLQAFSVHGILDVGGARSMTILSAFAWLSRHHPGSMMAADQADSLKMAETTGSPRNRFFIALACALVVGFAAANWSHLSAYYDLGSNIAGGGDGQGEYRARVAVQEFQKMAQQVTVPPFRDATRLGFVGVGAGVAVGLALLRRVWFGSPFHPLGFILATAYGDSSTFIFPMFVAWLLKWLLLRAGGLRLYRAGLPFFIGLIVGHFSLAGIVWPVMSVFISPETSAGYHTYFG